MPQKRSRSSTVKQPTTLRDGHHRSPLSSSSSGSSVSTSPDEERAKHYPMFEDSYLDHTNSFLRDASLPMLEQPFMQKDPTTQKYLLYGRFLVIHQLGKGTYSKVVLAKDLHCTRSSSSSSSTEFVAIKVFRGERNYDDAFNDEIEVLEALSQPLPTRAGSSSPSSLSVAQKLANVIDDAMFDGAHAFSRLLLTIRHRVHRAIVFPALGMSLLDLLQHRKSFFSSLREASKTTTQGVVSLGRRPCAAAPYERFHRGGLPLFAVRSIAYQLLAFLCYCRRKGVVHTDLKPENILLQHKKMLPCGAFGPMPATFDVKVIDFGSAEFVNDFSHVSPTDGSRESFRTIQTRHYRAPEVIFGSGWSHPADLWSVGLILWELLEGEALFMTHEDEEHLAMMERFLGPPPPHDGGYWSIFQRGDRASDFLTRRHSNSGSLRWPAQDTPRRKLKYVDEIVPLDAKLREYGQEDEEYRRFADFMRRILDWNPHKRLSAAGALSHPFLASP